MKRDYPDRPIVAVGVVVIKDDHVLLIRRNKAPKSDQWSIPGGAQEVGETLQETAIREVREETAITIGHLHLLDVVDFIDRDATQDIRHHYTLIDYAARYHRGDIRSGDDAAEAKWVPLTEVSHYNLWQETERMIHKAAAQFREASP